MFSTTERDERAFGPGPHEEHDPFADPRPRYRLCRAAFVLGAIALGLQCASIALRLIANFGGIPELFKLIGHPRWGLFIGTPITWSAVVGSYLLIGRWSDTRWNRRVGVLVVLNSIDLYFWAADNAEFLGLKFLEISSNWVRFAGGVLQWFELMLFASLAADVAAHLGRKEAPEAARASRSLATVGLIVWAVLLVSATTWTVWPPLFQIASIETFLLYLAMEALLGITAFQVMLLCTLAARSCARKLAELQLAEGDHDLLRPPSDAFDDWPSHPDDPWK